MVLLNAQTSNLGNLYKITPTSTPNVLLGFIGGGKGGCRDGGGGGGADGGGGGGFIRDS